MPKCGSTFLQQIGFTGPPEIALIWEPGIPLFFELRDQVDSPDFDLSDFQHRLGKYVETRKKAAHADAKVVFSFEGFCGPQLSCKNDRLLAESLYELVGQTRVVFIVREQYKLLFSLWAQYVKEGGTLSLKRFLQSSDSPAIADPEDNIYRRVLFDRYIRVLHDVFGRENVGVFFFEDFVSDYDRFMSDLYRFIGVDVQQTPQNEVLWRGPNYINANIFRWLNKTSCTKQGKGLLPYKFYLWYRKFFARKIFPSKKWNRSSRFDTRRLVPEPIQEQLSESNTILAAMVDRDLSPLGYR